MVGSEWGLAPCTADRPTILSQRPPAAQAVLTPVALVSRHVGDLHRDSPHVILLDLLVPGHLGQSVALELP